MHSFSYISFGNFVRICWKFQMQLLTRWHDIMACWHALNTQTRVPTAQWMSGLNGLLEQIMVFMFNISKYYICLRVLIAIANKRTKTSEATHKKWQKFLRLTHMHLRLCFKHAYACVYYLYFSTKFSWHNCICLPMTRVNDWPQKRDRASARSIPYAAGH